MRGTAGRGKAVHPRGCGEHIRPALDPLRLDGSSPRVRGTPQNADRAPAPIRFIPAGAGNTRGLLGIRGGIPVHPRGCGEHVSGFIRPPRRAGSSPRVRGTPRQNQPVVRRRRFIPAGAGNTCRACGSRLRRPVHPRGCGEHSRPGCPEPSDNGSSPRVRGTLWIAPEGEAQRRFIPAGAGNTCFRPSTARTSPVHPRGCGEHDLGGCPGGPDVRFIPAGAGNTRGRWRCRSQLPVHPRGCGEHAQVGDGALATGGSSPRVRGTHRRRGGRGGQGRFIPAGAGNTSTVNLTVLAVAVHPRGCGEHVAELKADETRAGSSPRVRGTLEIALRAGDHRRFIPAGAGNTAWTRTASSSPAVHPRGCGEH